MMLKKTKYWLVLCMALLCAAVSTPTALHAAPQDPIWQLQVYLWTGDVKNAGTDDAISVSLAPGNKTVLNTSGDDFRRANGRLYELSWKNVYKLEDIEYFKIETDGREKNGWCLNLLRFYVNGQLVHSKSFGDSKQCQWIDVNNGHRPSYTISGAEIQQAIRRNYNHQTAVNKVLRDPIKLDALEGMIEGKVGNLINGTIFSWGKMYGSGYVEAKVKSSGSMTQYPVLSVDLDLKIEHNNQRDSTVDVDFDLVFECKNGFLHGTVKNVRQHIDWSVGVGTTGYITGGPVIFYNMDYKWPSCAPLIATSNRELIFIR